MGRFPGFQYLSIAKSLGNPLLDQTLKLPPALHGHPVFSPALQQAACQARNSGVHNFIFVFFLQCIGANLWQKIHASQTFDEVSGENQCRRPHQQLRQVSDPFKPPSQLRHRQKAIRQTLIVALVATKPKLKSADCCTICALCFVSVFAECSGMGVDCGSCSLSGPKVAPWGCRRSPCCPRVLDH